MAKAPKFGSDADFAKHVAQPAHIAHQGKDSFFVKGGFITYSAGAGDAGKPIKLGASGKIDTTMLPAISFDHGDLTGLQGGQVGQYYHLNATEHPYVSGVNAQSLLKTASPEFVGLNLSNYIRSAFSGAVTYLNVAHYYEGATTTGIICITLDNTPNCMIDAEIVAQGYGGVGIYNIRGYTYTGDVSWHAPFASVYGSGNLHGVRFCKRTSDNARCIWLGTTTTSWGNYIHASVPRVTRGHGGVDIGDWSISLLTSETGYSEITSVDVNKGNHPFGTTISVSDSAQVPQVKSLTTLELAALNGFVDIIPDTASYGMVIRKHDSGLPGGNPYANFFVEDAAIDYLNIVITAVGSQLGLVVDANDNVGVGKVATAGYKLDANGIIRGTRLISSIATGTSPLTVASQTVVVNLNADLLDGYNSTSFPQLVMKNTRATSGTLTLGTWTAISLTSQTSANATWALIYTQLITRYDTHQASFKACAYNVNNNWFELDAYCGSRIAFDAHGSGALGVTYNAGSCWIKLDSSQRISYYATTSTQGHIGVVGADQFWVLAYIEEK